MRNTVEMAGVTFILYAYRARPVKSLSVPNMFGIQIMTVFSKMFTHTSRTARVLKTKLICDNLKDISYSGQWWLSSGQHTI